MILTHKGILIGLGLGAFKVMQSMRSGKFKWSIATTDMIGSVIMGYGSWEMAITAELSTPVVVAVTIILALNAFLVVHIFTNPAVFKALVKTFTKIDVDEDRKDE